MKKITLGLLIAAAIILPLAMIAGAVESIGNHTEAQVISEPTAKVSAKSNSEKSIEVDVTIERSQYVFIPEYQNDAERGTRYYYGQSYNVVLIDWENYLIADAKAKKENEQSSVSIKKYVDKEFSIEETKRPIDGSAPIDEKHNVTFDIIKEYIFTTDTQVQTGKNYYELKDGEYVIKELNVGSEIKPNTYYEMNTTTKFNIRIANLYSKHEYAIAVQFYYSLNDSKNNLYNSSYQQKILLTTK